MMGTNNELAAKVTVRAAVGLGLALLASCALVGGIDADYILQAAGGSGGNVSSGGGTGPGGTGPGGTGPTGQGGSTSSGMGGGGAGQGAAGGGGAGQGAAGGGGQGAGGQGAGGKGAGGQGAGGKGAGGQGGGGQGPTCENKSKDGDETDVDCGGSCPPCADGKSCLTHSDCVSERCAASCIDWARAFNPTEMAGVHGIGILAGAIVAAGDFSGSLVLNKSYAATNGDWFVAALNSSGMSYKWSHSFGGVSSDILDSVATSSNRIALLGGCTSMLAGKIIGQGAMGDACIVVLDGAGNTVWATSFDSSQADFATAAVFDTSGDLYVGGQGATFAGCGAAASSMSPDAFVARLEAANGNCKWRRALAGPGYDGVGALAVDGGVLYAIGTSYGGFAIDSSSFTVLGSADAYLATFNAANGSVTKLTAIGGVGYDAGRGVAVMASGELALGLSLAGNVTVGGKTVQATTMGGALVGYQPATDKTLWHHVVAGESVDATRLAVASGRAALVGYYSKSAKFNGVQSLITTADLSDKAIFVISSAVDGQQEEAASFNSTGEDVGAAVAINPSSANLLVGGWATASLIFGNDTLLPPTNYSYGLLASLGSAP